MQELVLQGDALLYVGYVLAEELKNLTGPLKKQTHASKREGLNWSAVLKVHFRTLNHDASIW